ncbi:hypothetical protein FXO38_15941 [Capsicum annuum]|nr:hypothetical protein FXO38_15941 [Capsicum annuum]KAF3685737.1 hypothetical protein FXO37_00314 [Capsicum annuum]
MLHGMPLAIQIWLYECCSAVPRTVAFKVDSQIPRLLNWKTNAILPRYESLIESLFNDSSDEVVFKNIEPTQKEISTFQIPKKTPIFKAIQSKETTPSNGKDIPVEPSDISFFNREDEDDVLSKKVFEKFRDEVRKKFNDIWNRYDQIMNSINEMKVKDYEFVKPQLDESDKDTSPHESTPILHHDFDKSPEGTLERSIIVHPSANKEQTPVNVSRIKRPSKFKESPFTTKFGLAEDTKVTNKFMMWLSVDLLKYHAKKSNKVEHYLKKKSKISALNFGILSVEDKNWFYVMGTPEQSWSDEQIDVCLYYLRKKSKYEPNISYMYSTVDCNFMNIVRVVLAVYSIDDPTINAGGKEYHLNEYISEFRMHVAIPWHTFDHIFIPINIKFKHHWVLAILSIYVYDSLSYAGHDSVALAEVEKLDEVIPYYLLACKFYEKKGIDIDKHSNYKLNNKHDLFYVTLWKICLNNHVAACKF